MSSAFQPHCSDVLLKTRPFPVVTHSSLRGNILNIIQAPETGGTCQPWNRSDVKTNDSNKPLSFCSASTLYSIIYSNIFLYEFLIVYHHGNDSPGCDTDTTYRYLHTWINLIKSCDLVSQDKPHGVWVREAVKLYTMYLYWLELLISRVVPLDRKVTGWSSDQTCTSEVNLQPLF